MNNRLARAAIFAALIATSVSASAFSRIRPGSLRCEYTENPTVIDDQCPRLSWINASEVNGEFQSAYRIRVASAPKLLRKADLWDSGKVESGESVLVSYGGTTLSSRQECCPVNNPPHHRAYP